MDSKGLFETVDFRGHCGYQPGHLVDLTAQDEEAGYWRRQLRFLELALETRGFGDDAEDILDQGPECGECGQRIGFECRNAGLVARSECAEPGGLGPYEVLLSVPSGRIVFANDLRHLVVLENTYPDVNTALGRKLQTQAAARLGMAYVSVGNSCPSVFVTPEGIDVAPPGHGRGKAEYRSAGTICTDLWWYCAMDHDFFLERCRDEDVGPEEDIDYFTVDVEPGVYSVSDELARGRQDDPVFSRIRKTEAAAEPPVVIGNHRSTCLGDSLFWRWVSEAPHFRRNRSLAERVADAVFVGGNGLDWVKGNLRSVSGRDDDPRHCAVLRGRDCTRDSSWVPTIPGLEGYELYPQAWDYPGKLGVAPSDIDTYWLAAGMMVVKTLMANGLTPMGAHRLDDAARRQREETDRAVLSASLDVLLEIAESRDRGVIEAAFGEIASASARKDRGSNVT